LPEHENLFGVRPAADEIPAGQPQYSIAWGSDDPGAGASPDARLVHLLPEQRLTPLARAATIDRAEVSHIAVDAKHSLVGWFLCLFRLVKRHFLDFSCVCLQLSVMCLLL
jgi:hypothetical protein